jgi:hypothetical protein
MYPALLGDHACSFLSSNRPKMLNKQGIANTLALPIDKMLYIYLLCPHSKHQKKSVPI